VQELLDRTQAASAERDDDGLDLGDITPRGTAKACCGLSI
jgi:hypothetical protein